MTVGLRLAGLALLVPAPAAATDCIHLNRVQAPVVTPDGALVYRRNARTAWSVRPVGSCPRLDPRVTIAVLSSGERLCRGDRFRILYPPVGAPGRVCRLGGFTPLP